MRMDKILILSVLVGLPVLLSGCGGVSASHSVSPASIFLPGLVQTIPKMSGEKYGPNVPIVSEKTNLTVCDQVIPENQGDINISL